jgi:hypothetical protein
MDGGLRGDAAITQVTPTLSKDAPVVNWDTRTCTGCNEGGGAGGTSSGNGGSSTSASGGGAKAGGSAAGGMAAGGMAAGSSGGVPGSGGKISTSGNGGRSLGMGGNAGWGGASAPGGADAGPQDTATKRDATADAMMDTMSPPVIDGAVSPDTSLTDARGTSDVYAGPCVMQIRALVPATSALEAFPLVAGDNVRVVLRAEILSGGPAAPVWDWQASRNGIPVSAAAFGQEDPGAVVFPVTGEGYYVFKATARASLCSAVVSANAAPVDLCQDCDRAVILRAAPPPDSQIPVQSGSQGLVGSPPFSQSNVVLARGVSVLVSPSVAGSKVDAYVRISKPDGELVTDGLAVRSVGFGTQLLRMDYDTLKMASYDLLMVPIDGPNQDVVAATAPQLFQAMTPEQINAASFALSGGVTVTGKTLAANGQAVADARVVLANRDPSKPSQPADLLFSSVGRADAQGNYALHAQPPGPYWVSVSPPNGSGLPEALAPYSISLPGDSVISFQWAAQPKAGLTLSVRDSTGTVPLPGARVRLSSAQATTVGTLTVAGVGTQDAVGNVRIEATTSSSGMVTFANLPAGVSYTLLIAPAALGPTAATTVLSVSVPVEGATLEVRAAEQRWIRGQLLSGATGAAPDWSKVRVVAYDRSTDTPEPPQTVNARSDGSYAIGVSSGRAYVVLVVPEVGSGLARTFMGPGALESSEFFLPQRVPAAMPWSALVMDEYQRPLAGTALQIFCEASWPRCVDPTVPLAETTSEAGGAFDLELPDPATR